MATFKLPGIPRISQGNAWTEQQRKDIRAIWDDLFRAENGEGSGGCDCDIDGGSAAEVYTPDSDIDGGGA